MNKEKLLAGGKNLLDAGGFDPLSAGLSFGVNALTSLASGAPLKRALPEALPIVGGIFKAGNAAKDAKAEQMEADITQKTADAKFGQMMGSNLPMAYGGELDPVTEFPTGGTHESNPLGGIPQGVNSVEQGEVKYKFPDGDYVFSNRLIYNYAK